MEYFIIGNSSTGARIETTQLVTQKVIELFKANLNGKGLEKVR